MTHFDVKQIRYFLRVADTGNVNKASRDLEISQPALTRQIQVLEENLNRRLFRRTPFGVDLTEAGKEFRDDCTAFMQLHRRAANSIEAQRRHQNRAIVVGLSSSVTSPRAALTSVLADIAKFQHHCDIAFVETGSDRIGMEMLSAKEIDVLLRCRVSPDEAGHDFAVDSVLLTTVLAVNPSSSGPMSIGDLEKKDVLVLEFGEDREIQSIIADACQDAGVSPASIAVTNSELGLLSFATNENRIGIRIGRLAGSERRTGLRPIKHLEIDHPPRFEVLSRRDDSNPMVGHVRAYHRNQVFSLLR